jgi:ribonuclease HI
LSHQRATSPLFEWQFAKDELAMIEIFTDGLAEPRNPGIGTYGFVVYRDGIEFRRGHGFDGDPVSNNHAEYAGLIAALRAVVGLAGEEIVVKSDSKMLVNQMAGAWKVTKRALNSTTEGTYVDKYLEAKEAARKFSKLTFEWIPRERNAEADELSRVAYREQLPQRRGR